jgi:hypothetical protein
MQNDCILIPLDTTTSGLFFTFKFLRSSSSIADKVQ